MASAYKSAGSGASTETSAATLNVPWPATVDANDIGILHAYYEGTTTAPATPAGFELLGGPYAITTVGRHWLFGKIAAGTEDGANASLGSAAVTTMRSGRLYTFSGFESGSLKELVKIVEVTMHATDPQLPTVETRLAGELAAAFVAQNDNNTIGSSTGESGGDWTEAVAEYTANLNPGLMLQLQTCTPTSNPGTVSGGTFNTENDPCGVIGVRIAPKPTTDLTFPTNTTVLDNFNRANGSLGSNWGKWGSLPVASIESERLKGEGAGNGGGSFIKEKFGPDCEAFITLAVAAGSGSFAGVAIRQKTPESSWDGYYVEISDGSSTTEIKIGSGETVSTLGSIIATPWAAGDKLGVSVIGNVIRAYRYPSGGSKWELLGQRSDSTFTESGYIALWRSGGTARLDDLSGGTIITEAGTKKGRAVLSGSGTLTAKARKGKRGKASLSGSGTLTSKGRTGRRAKATLTAKGTLTADGVKGPRGKAVLTGKGELTARGKIEEQPTPPLEDANDLTTLGGYNRINPKKLRGWR